MFGLSKGRIYISTDKDAYKPGDAINVRVQLSLDEPIKARALHCEFFARIASKKTENTI